MIRAGRAAVLFVLAALCTVVGPARARAQAPAGATAQCRDGSYSFSANRSGTCSHHGGVARWLTPSSTTSSPTKSTAPSNDGVIRATNGTVLTPAHNYVALKLKPPLPTHVDGIVTPTLASGATIRLRAQDIDWEKTAKYIDRVVILPETFTMMHAGDGRPYFNMTFSNRYVVTAWQDDVDLDAMRPPGARAAESVNRGAVTYANYARLADGMSIAQVTELLGVEPVEISRAEIAGAQTVLLQWKQESAVVVAMFKDGKLFSKLPFGLR